MDVSSKTQDVVRKVTDGLTISAEEIRWLLRIEPHSIDAGYVIASADAIGRAACDAKAEVHAQIGLNLSPCPRNCLFCAFAARNGVFRERTELGIDEVVQMAETAEAAGCNALFFMTTGDYPFPEFIEISAEVRAKLLPETVMVANIGDFGPEEARRLKDAGYAGIYHAVRMGEGRDTSIPPETRLATVRVAREAGLLIGTCVEPIGPEHDDEEILEKILIGRDMEPCFSGAMRRISIPGSEMEAHGMISESRLAYLVAVVRLAMGRTLIGNCTHEPNLLGPNAGANLFWAEVGTNPRDTKSETSEGRGMDVHACSELFRESDFEVLKGPSLIYSEAGLSRSHA